MHTGFRHPFRRNQNVYMRGIGEKHQNTIVSAVFVRYIDELDDQRNCLVRFSHATMPVNADTLYPSREQVQDLIDGMTWEKKLRAAAEARNGDEMARLHQWNDRNGCYHYGDVVAEFGPDVTHEQWIDGLVKTTNEVLADCEDL
jgi:hypothetical protein